MDRKQSESNLARLLKCEMFTFWAKSQNALLHDERATIGNTCPKAYNILAYTHNMFGWTCVLGAQKNRLNETVLLSTHNICLDEK